VDEMVDGVKKNECVENKSTRIKEKYGTRNQTDYVLHRSQLYISLTSKTTNHPNCTQNNYSFPPLVMGLWCNETTAIKVFRLI
jgi:hypothetical protein